eukprot:2015330-Rhodomonas_salina.1
MSSFVEGRSGSVLGRHSEGDVRKLELKIEADSSGGAGADGTEISRRWSLGLARQRETLRCNSSKLLGMPYKMTIQ